MTTFSQQILAAYLTLADSEFNSSLDEPCEQIVHNIDYKAAPERPESGVQGIRAIKRGRIWYWTTRIKNTDHYRQCTRAGLDSLVLLRVSAGVQHRIPRK